VTHHADQILHEGFHDAHGWNCAAREYWEGVWLESRPSAQQGPGTRTLVVDIPEDEILAFEHRDLERNLPYREFIVPSAVVNRFGPPAELGAITA
jgi:hypothetical protein